MTDEPEKPKKPRNRTAEYARRVRRRLAAAGDDSLQDSEEDVTKRDFSIELSLLKKRTEGNPTDADADIDFAYRNMESPDVNPLSAPSTAAWSWYIYSREYRSKFLEICFKREDAKAKLAGTITNQRMEDDKRQQFSMIDRIEKELTLNIKETIKDLMEKYPGDVLEECRKYKESWKAFMEKEKTREPIT